MNLAIKRPTPTTVQYTVSTRAQASTWPSKLANLLLIALRLLAAAAVLIIFIDESATISFLSNITLLSNLRNTLLQTSSPLTAFLIRPNGSIAQLYPWWRWARFAASIAVAMLVAQKGYTEESLLVIRGLGVQTETSSSLYFFSGRTRFIPTSSVQDIFIHEAFIGFEARYYLGIVVDGEDGVAVVFPNTLPSREIVENVWRGARACLYEPKT